jgi:hypothetical protein
MTKAPGQVGYRTPLLGLSTSSVRDLQPCRRRSPLKLPLMSRAAIKERFNIDATGGQQGLSPVIRKSRIIAPSAASLREFAPLCTSPKWLTEGAFLPSTIRHQHQRPTLHPVGFFSFTHTCLRGFIRFLADFEVSKIHKIRSFFLSLRHYPLYLQSFCKCEVRRFVIWDKFVITQSCSELTVS